MPDGFVVVQPEVSAYWHNDLLVSCAKAPLRIRIGVRVDETVMSDEVVRRRGHTVPFEIFRRGANHPIDRRKRA